MHKDKIAFLKVKGICFGCLKLGHMNKDCKAHLTYKVCDKRHPSILHIKFKGNEMKAEDRRYQ